MNTILKQLLNEVTGMSFENGDKYIKILYPKCEVRENTDDNIIDIDYIIGEDEEENELIISFTTSLITGEEEDEINYNQGYWNVCGEKGEFTYKEEEEDTELDFTDDEILDSIEKDLKDQLINKEFNLSELERKMSAYCYTAFDYAESDIKEILESGSVIYLFKHHDQNQIFIDFDVTIEVNTKEESIFATYVKILDIWVA